MITADFKVIAESNADNQSRDGHRTAFVMQDWQSKTLAGYPAKNRTTEETKMHNLKFLCPGVVPKAYYSDNAPTSSSDGDIWFDSTTLRLYVQHGGAWIYPDRVEDTVLKTSLLNAVNSSADYASLKANLITALS